MEVRVKLTPLLVCHMSGVLLFLVLFVVVLAYVVVHCIFVSSVLRCSYNTVDMAAYDISVFLN